MNDMLHKNTETQRYTIPAWATKLHQTDGSSICLQASQSISARCPTNAFHGCLGGSAARGILHPIDILISPNKVYEKDISERAQHIPLFAEGGNAALCG